MKLANDIALVTWTSLGAVERTLSEGGWLLIKVLV